ncbi:hypothetical protein D6C85_02532 [Aureobasidium pullulans]|uniref:C2H2-type domain-containing protein n=1 Tax=Aureobasidium pullulans TaxID=5580 RepID=A0A4S9XC29_AURPU|nr:hypothetical protein D6C85_02532 [Aureobasidium pullulans]
MAAAQHAFRSPSTGSQHIATGRSNPWLDTVLSTEPTPPEPVPKSRRDNPYTKTESPVTRPPSPSTSKRKPSCFASGRTSSNQPSSSSPPRKAKPKQPPAQTSLDEAFKAAIKAIVPEREAATRKARKAAKGRTLTIQSPHITTLTPIPHQPPRPKIEPELRTAVDKLTFSRLRTVVYKTLNSSPQARAIFEKEVLTVQPIDSGVDEGMVGMNKRPRFEMCRLCKSEFDVTENAENSCVHHSGELEPDERAWQDHDSVENGPIDTAENKENHPDCFRWDCCSGEGDDDGCETTAHEADEAFNHKRPKRYWEF